MKPQTREQDETVLKLLSLARNMPTAHAARQLGYSPDYARAVISRIRREDQKTSRHEHPDDVAAAYERVQ